VLRECGITLNRNSLPYDANGPWYTSGLRIGTPAATTLGMKEPEMREIAKIFKHVLSNTTARLKTKGKDKGAPSKTKYDLPEHVTAEARDRVGSLLDRFPLYPELDMDLLLPLMSKEQG
jgi:glycine hydroxymethyltransferase